MAPSEQLNARLRPLVAGYYDTHDEALLGQVLELLRPLLLAYARHTLSVRDAERAEDVAQDGLVQVLLSLRSGRLTLDGGSVVGFARVCCQHRYIDSLRRPGARSTRPGNDDDPYLLLSPAMATQPDELPVDAEQEAEAGGLLAAATGAVLNLDPNARAAVVLHYYQGLPVPEAAARLGLDEQQYRTRLNRGLAALRTWGEGQSHPSGEVYARLPYLPTGDLFTEPLRLAG